MVFVMLAVICFCVVIPQKTPPKDTSTSAGVMIDKTPTISAPQDEQETQIPDVPNDENKSENLPENEKKPEDDSLKDDEGGKNENSGESVPNESEDESESLGSENEDISSNEKHEQTNPFLQNLNFFVQEKAITKTKQKSGNVTTFEISFRVFVSNSSIGTKTISVNAFSADYEAGEGLLYYTTTVDGNANMIELGSYESTDFEFTIKYIIVDDENFDLNKENNLVISYMFDEIISVNI